MMFRLPRRSTLRVPWILLPASSLMFVFGCGGTEEDVAVSPFDALLGRDEVVLATFAKRFELTDDRLSIAKVMDQSSGQIREIVLSTYTGDETSYETSARDFRDAWLAHYGPVDRSLARHFDGEGTPGELLAMAVEAEAGELQALHSQVTEEMGLQAEIDGGQLVVTGGAGALRSVAQLPGIEAATLVEAKENLALTVAEEMNQEPLAVAHRVGWGHWIQAAVWELDACINRGHPHFASIDWEPRHSGTACYTSAQAGHSTKVTGVLAADRGADATVGIFRGHVFDVDARSNAAEADMWSRNPHIVNASFTIGPHDGRDIDREVYDRGIFVFNGSGNGDAGTADARCYAYNALCVGGFTDNDTPTNFGDDAVAGGSRYLNYSASQREVPQVVGPWRVRSTARYNGGTVADSGTSYSTPAVAGTAGLLLANYAWPLWRKPALLRAVLMASAQAHPVTAGGERRIPSFSDALDDKAGVGVPHGGRAKQIMDNNQFWSRDLTPTDLGEVASINVSSSERLRVVLAWDQCPGYDVFAPELNADLDMVVLGPSGQTFSNLSRVDNYEAVEFVAPASGAYRVMLSAPTWNPCASEGGARRVPVGLSWTKEPGPRTRLAIPAVFVRR